MDIRNFEEAWEWTNSVLMDGLFESDVDDTGNIMMYNQLVGAVRLRQLRVTNTSCELSPRIMRRVVIENAGEFTQSFVFQARDAGGGFGDGGGCYSAFDPSKADKTDFGPCTEGGRIALVGTPQLTLDHNNKYNESCGGPDPSEGSVSACPEDVLMTP